MQKITKLDVEESFRSVLKELPIYSPLNLSRRRHKFNLTQKQAARISRVNLFTWRSWEYGVNPMPEVAWAYFLSQTDALEKFWDKKIKWRRAGEKQNEEVEDDWG